MQAPFSTASEEYYQLLMSSENQPCGLDLASYSVAEVESVTSEFIGKNGVSCLEETHSPCGQSTRLQG